MLSESATRTEKLLEVIPNKIADTMGSVDLRLEVIELFKEKAVRRGRLTPKDAKAEDSILLDNFHLIDEDGY